jgi:hypothetical protein
MNNLSETIATSRHERSSHVVQMRANFSIEGMEPSADDRQLQQRYIDGTVSLEEMLQHARAYARRCHTAQGAEPGGDAAP